MNKLCLAFAAAAACGAALADETKAPEGMDQEEETPAVSVEFGLSFDSRYMTYGVIDGKDPILTPSAQVTFFDWVYFGIESIFDMTKGNGKRGGYGNRAGQYTTLDSIAGLAHEFDLGEDLGTLGVDLNYIYEYIPRYHGSMDDTSYVNLELSLGGHWLEPTLGIERDLMADDGMYINLELGHTFALIDGEEESEDPVLSFCPSVGQGFGNSNRTHGYFAETSEGFHHTGLMDTTIKGELTWNICENLSLSGYIAFSDYWFDGNMRNAARAYNSEWGKGCDHSWNFYGGIALGLAF